MAWALIPAVAVAGAVVLLRSASRVRREFTSTRLSADAYRVDLRRSQDRLRSEKIDPMTRAGSDSPTGDGLS